MKSVKALLYIEMHKYCIPRVASLIYPHTIGMPNISIRSAVSNSVRNSVHQYIKP